MSKHLNKNFELHLFDIFKEALKSLFLDYSYLLDSKKTKIAITHRLATEIEKKSENKYVVDIFFPLLFDRATTPEIAIKDKNGTLLMAIFLEEEYLAKSKKEEASYLHDKSDAFTLAISLLNEKNYVLIYRFSSSFTDYLHLSKTDFKESLLKRIEDDKDDENLLLFKLKKKRKSKS